MTKKFNFTRCIELHKKEIALSNEKKSLFDENRLEFLELLSYEASIQRQITYSRKNDYSLLIKKYLNRLISGFEFQREFLRIANDDGEKAKQILEDYQKLSSFSFVENCEEFHNLFNELWDLCLDLGDLGYTEKMSKDKFYEVVNNLYLQIQKY